MYYTQQRLGTDKEVGSLLSFLSNQLFIKRIWLGWQACSLLVTKYYVHVAMHIIHMSLTVNKHLPGLLILF